MTSNARTNELLGVYEQEIDNLKFENSQLHEYTDYLEGKLKALQQFLHQGITYQKMQFEDQPSESNQKHLAFLQDAYSIAEDVSSNQVLEETRKPRLKSIYDLK